jgi:hypothetical protein
VPAKNVRVPATSNSIDFMNTPQSLKSSGREAAEAIAASHGEKPKVITTKMVGTAGAVAVETFIKDVLGSMANAYKDSSPQKIRAAA